MRCYGPQPEEAVVEFEASGGRSRWLVFVFDGELDLNCLTLKLESDVQKA